MNYDVLFEKRLSKFKGLVKYVKDPDYHGKIITVNIAGCATRPRDNCSNENIEHIVDSVRVLQKMKTDIPFDAWKARVLRDTSAQIQFLGQCFLDRLYAKGKELLRYFQKYDTMEKATTPGALGYLISIVSHEYPLEITLSALTSSMRLRQSVGKSNGWERGWDDLQESFRVISRLRLMVTQTRFGSQTKKEKISELKKSPDKLRELRTKYASLLHSKRWRQIMLSIESAERNTHSTSRFEMRTHRERMAHLLEIALSAVH
jgi:hypothetical protein